ncbi:MAG TPA: GNAT family protein [Gemmatimonadales bacterium]|nr:GNAT family protein [Gemmatimonadales bacterium]
MPLNPVLLEGRHIRLEPLSPDHLPGLLAVGLDPVLWKWTLNKVNTPADLERYVETALAEQRAGTSLPFATVLQANGQVIGSTRFGNISLPNKRAEIGWTWIGRPWQRTGANTEAKLLMLTHAFETLGMARVELKTNVLNTQSRHAMLRIGCVEEGILRQHAIADDGTTRDTVYYSILRAEWPEVKKRLTGWIER